MADRPIPGVERALVIAGSDRRGYIYGIYELLRRLGVSPWYWWLDASVAHLTLNDWIRANKDVDGVIDFDTAVRDPANPSALIPAYSDDWLHLNPTGYEAMGKFAADAIK